MSEALRAALAAHADTLSQRVLDEMYDNPWWMERYGERGRRFANEDARYHLSYLDQALASGDAAVFVKYGRWLRGVLVSRGMCSEHLAEHFRRLADEIERQQLPDAVASRPILEAGARALDYDDGRAARFADKAERQTLLDAIAGAAGPAMRDDDREYLVSYLLDALDTGEWQFFDQFAARFPPGVGEALKGVVGPVDRNADPSESARK